MITVHNNFYDDGKRKVSSPANVTARIAAPALGACTIWAHSKHVTIFSLVEFMINIALSAPNGTNESMSRNFKK